MALMIRLRQQGAKNSQTYRLVVTDRRTPRDGKYIEMVGWYNPLGADDKTTFVKADRVQFWLEKGATFSEKARALVRRFCPEVIRALNEKHQAKKLKETAKKKKKSK